MTNLNHFENAHISSPVVTALGLTEAIVQGDDFHE